MTTLYKSPPLLIDGHEWFVCVRCVNNRSFTQFRWRPHDLQKRYAFQNAEKWTGPKPKGLRRFFAPYLKHAEQARAGVRKVTP